MNNIFMEYILINLYVWIYSIWILKLRNFFFRLICGRERIMIEMFLCCVREGFEDNF